MTFDLTAADKVLVPSSSGGAPAVALTSPFSAATDYVYVDAFEKGANSGCLFAINKHKIYIPWARGPHYVVLRALPPLPQPATSTDKPKPHLNSAPPPLGTSITTQLANNAATANAAIRCPLVTSNTISGTAHTQWCVHETGDSSSP